MIGLRSKNGYGAAFRVVAMTLAVSVAMSALGCSVTRPRSVSKAEYVPEKNERITSVDLVAGGKIEFDSEGGSYVLLDRVIRGASTAGEQVEIGIDEVSVIHVNRVSTSWSLTATFLGLAGLSVMLIYVLGLHAQWVAN
jgi:hypothetical protein